MAQVLSEQAENLSQKQEIKPQLIFEAEGLPFLFGTADVKVPLIWGAGWRFGDPGVRYGGGIADATSRDYISLSKTTKNISQQLQSDRVTVSGASRFKVELIDFNEEVSKILQPGNYVSDPLGIKGDVYINFDGGVHPQDSIKIFTGVIDALTFTPGVAVVELVSPEKLKSVELFPEIVTELDGAIDASQTSGIILDSIVGVFEGADICTSFIRVEDEIIQFTGFSGNELTGVTRGALGTIAASHDDAAEATTIYRLQGGTIELALKLMLSGNNTNFVDDVSVFSFNEIQPVQTISNAIFFQNEDVAEKYGVVVGDFVSSAGATNPANDFTDRTIVEIFKNDQGSWIVVDGASLVSEGDTAALVSFKSKYAVLPDGCFMDPTQVDVAEFERKQALFSTRFPDHDFRLKETKTGAEIINKEILYPAGIYSIPRKGKASLNVFVPPLAEADTKTLDLETVTNVTNLPIVRTTNKEFYNAITYRYEENDLEAGDFLAGEIVQSSESTNRIKVKNKTLNIDAPGLRKGGDTRNFILAQSDRFLDRFKFAARTVKAKVNFKTGFNIDVGDSVILVGSELKISDSQSGDRDFATKIFEVMNKKFSWQRGEISLDLIDSGFGIDGRFGTIAPSSYVGTGATVTRLPLKISFGTEIGQREDTKWQDYIGKKVIVHSQDFTIIGETIISAIDPVEENVLVVDPLGFAPGDDYIIELANYPTGTDQNENQFEKALHVYQNPRVEVVSGASSTQFDVAPADVGKFQVEAIVRVHNFSFSDDSGDVKITDITGTTITVEDMGYTPGSGDFIDLIGFADAGLPYRFI